MDKKKIINDVLFKFYNTNLSSEAARGWIAEEIVKKLDNPEHEVMPVLQSESVRRGMFEEYLSDGGREEQVKEQQKTFKSQLENNRLQKEKAVKEEVVSKPNKRKPKPKNVSPKKAPTKNLKNIKKPRGKFL